MQQNYYKRDELQASKSTSNLSNQDLLAKLMLNNRMQPSSSNQNLFDRKHRELAPKVVEQPRQRTPEPTAPSRPSMMKQKVAINQPAIDKATMKMRTSYMGKSRAQTEADEEVPRFKFMLPVHVIIKLQACYRRRVAKKHYQVLWKKQRYRRSIVNELVDTERAYLRDIKLLCIVQQDLKEKTHRQNDRIIGNTDIKSLFQNIDAIKGLSEEMLQGLEEVSKAFYGSTRIGQRMKKYAQFFKFYFEYCNNFPSCQKLYAQLKKVEFVSPIHQDNTKFRDYIQMFQKEQLQGQLFESFLIKPVQRVPKYMLLLKDLLKNTHPKHVDYADIQQALDMFIKVNEDNNKNMDKVITNQKLFELQKLFGDKHLMIVDGRREFKSEESLKIFLNYEVKSVIVYFLTDLVLITEREDNVKQNRTTQTTYKLLKHVMLDQNSSSEELDDTSDIQYLFRLIGKNETITLIADDTKNQQKFITYLNDLIATLKANSQNRSAIQDAKGLKQSRPSSKYPILVKVLGTQEVQESSVKTFTQYIVQVDIANVVQKVYLRFSHFKDIQNEVRSLFPKLKLPYFKDSNIFSNHEVKVIEARKLQMMDFLQTLLTSDEMEKNGKDILKMLGLPLNFYTLPELLQNPDVVLRTDSVSIQMLKSQQNKSGSYGSRTASVFYNNFADLRETMKNNQASIVSPRQQPVRVINDKVLPKPEELRQPSQTQPNMTNITQLPKPMEVSQLVGNMVSSRSNSTNNRKISATKLTRGSLPINSTQGSMISSKSEKEGPTVTIKIQVLTYPKTSQIEITITPDTRGGDAFEDAMMQAGLQVSFDFKLYIQERGVSRPIEEDELLWTLLVEKQQVASTTSQKITQMMKRVHNYIYNYNQKPVTVKKHLYLPEEQEREHYEDAKRVELIATQTFLEIQTGQLKLNDTEYTMATALRLFLDGFHQIDEISIPMEKISEYLPITVFKSIPKDNWIYMLPDMVKGFQDEVNTILQQDQIRSPIQSFVENPESTEQPRLSQHSHQLTSSEDGEQERVQIGQLVFLKLISQTQFYGLKVFDVTPDKETRNSLQTLCQAQFREYLKTLSKSAQSQSTPLVTGLKLKFCVGYNAISIYSDFKQIRPLVLLEYREIQQLKAHPLSLVLQLQSEMQGGNTGFQVKKATSLHFDTSQSFVIQMLIEEYKQMRESIENMDEDFMA